MLVFAAACAADPPEGSRGDVGEAESGLSGKGPTKGCATWIRCAPGYTGVDTDGDGCNDACQRVCEVWVRCAPGYVAVDTDGDGCNDTCQPAKTP